MFFDAGEGAALRLLSTDVSLTQMMEIFITHNHADHLLGLPGLLIAIHEIRKVCTPPVQNPVVLFGPPGIGAYVDSIQRTTWAFTREFVRIFEILPHPKDSVRHSRVSPAHMVDG